MAELPTFKTGDTVALADTSPPILDEVIEVKQGEGGKTSYLLKANGLFDSDQVYSP